MNASANFFTQKKLLDSTHLSFIVSKTEIKTKKQYTDAILVANMFRMFVCNLASDGVIIQYPHESNTIIDKKDVIDSFPEQALGMFTKDLKEAYVLTGPGSFTTLRVGALTINTVMMTS